MLDAHAHGSVAAPAVYLGPSGHAGADLVPQHVVRELSAELFDELRALRSWPDDAHVALEDIEKLRQLVERPGADETAHPRSTRVVALRPLRSALVLRPHFHRAELENAERLSIETHAHLAIENRTAILQPDGQGDQQHERREDEKRRAGHHQIESPLHEAAPSLQRSFRQVDRRQPVDILDARAEHHELQQIGNDVNRNETAHQAFEQPVHGS